MGATRITYEGIVRPGDPQMAAQADRPVAAVGDEHPDHHIVVVAAMADLFAQGEHLGGSIIDLPNDGPRHHSIGMNRALAKCFNRDVIRYR